MLTIRNQSVNVDRLELLNQLKLGLAQHKLEYDEVVTDFKMAAKKFANESVERINNNDFSNLYFDLQLPSCHEKEYTDIIEMLEFSQDAIINLDATAFRAYIKNEWQWKNSFEDISRLIKSY